MEYLLITVLIGGLGLACAYLGIWYERAQGQKQRVRDHEIIEQERIDVERIRRDAKLVPEDYID